MVGTALFGKTDAVLGWGHVATRFFHIAYVPLIPLGSVHVTDDNETSPIATSARSIALGWLGGATLATLLAGLVMIDVQPALTIPLLAAAFLTFVVLQLPWLRRATWERAMVIADAIDARPIQRVKLAKAYGKISEEAALKSIQRLNEMFEPSDDERSALQAEAIDRVVADRERERQERIARERAEIESRIQKRASRAPLAIAMTTTSRSAVKFACPHCLKTSKVPAKHVGRKGRCSHCRGKLRVPPPARAASWALQTALV